MEILRSRNFLFHMLPTLVQSSPLLPMVPADTESEIPINTRCEFFLIITRDRNSIEFNIVHFKLTLSIVELTFKMWVL